MVEFTYFRIKYKDHVFFIEEDMASVEDFLLENYVEDMLGTPLNVILANIEDSYEKLTEYYINGYIYEQQENIKDIISNFVGKFSEYYFVNHHNLPPHISIEKVNDMDDYSRLDDDEIVFDDGIYEIQEQKIWWGMV